MAEILEIQMRHDGTRRHCLNFVLKPYVIDLLGGFWLGREDSNLRMAESKSAALPLGYAPPCYMLKRNPSL